ncbi:hypothetical protein GCM10010505_00430 [Kitasatospora aburaviensis]
MVRGAGQVHLDPATVEAVHTVQQGAQPRRAFDDIAQTHGFRPLRNSSPGCVTTPGAAYSRPDVLGKAAGSGQVTVLCGLCRDRCGGPGRKTPVGQPAASGGDGYGTVSGSLRNP